MLGVEKAREVEHPVEGEPRRARSDRAPGAPVLPRLARRDGGRDEQEEGGARGRDGRGGPGHDAGGSAPGALYRARESEQTAGEEEERERHQDHAAGAVDRQAEAEDDEEDDDRRQRAAQADGGERGQPGGRVDDEHEEELEAGGAGQLKGEGARRVGVGAGPKLAEVEVELTAESVGARRQGDLGAHDEVRAGRQQDQRGRPGAPMDEPRSAGQGRQQSGRHHGGGDRRPCDACGGRARVTTARAAKAGEVQELGRRPHGRRSARSRLTEASDRPARRSSPRAARGR